MPRSSKRKDWAPRGCNFDTSTMRKKGISSSKPLKTSSSNVKVIKMGSQPQKRSKSLPYLTTWRSTSSCSEARPKTTQMAFSQWKGRVRMGWVTEGRFWIQLSKLLILGSIISKFSIRPIQSEALGFWTRCLKTCLPRKAKKIFAKIWPKTS